MSKITDQYIGRTITLMRAAEGEALEVSKKLHDIMINFAKDIERVYTGGDLTRLQYKSIRGKVEKELKGFYTEQLPIELQDAALAAVVSELDWNERVLLGTGAAKVARPENKIVLKQAARKTYQGHTFDYWAKREFKRKSRTAVNILNESFLQGVPIEKTSRRIAGLTGKATADVRTLVRSNFMHNATEAKERMVAKNKEIVQEVMWISVLDNRTTPLLCGIRDGLKYDAERNPINHDIPWLEGPSRLHWNCRSTWAPLVPGIDSGSGYRASVDAGANYKRGDKTTRTGRVRKARKGERDKGLFKISRRRFSTRYENWIKEQSRHNIDYVSDILGSKKNAIRLRNGEVTLRELGLESPVARPLNRNLI